MSVLADGILNVTVGQRVYTVNGNVGVTHHVRFFFDL